MTPEQLTNAAAERCAELANAAGVEGWDADEFRQHVGSRTAFLRLVEQAHTLAREAIAHPERAAEILAPLLLPEPVDPLEQRILEAAREMAARENDRHGEKTAAAKYRAGERDQYLSGYIDIIREFIARNPGLTLPKGEG